MIWPPSLQSYSLSWSIYLFQSLLLFSFFLSKTAIYKCFECFMLRINYIFIQIFFVFRPNNPSNQAMIYNTTTLSSGLFYLNRQRKKKTKKFIVFWLWMKRCFTIAFIFSTLVLLEQNLLFEGANNITVYLFEQFKTWMICFTDFQHSTILHKNRLEFSKSSVCLEVSKRLEGNLNNLANKLHELHFIIDVAYVQ